MIWCSLPANPPNWQVRRLGLKIALSAKAAEGKLVLVESMATHGSEEVKQLEEQLTGLVGSPGSGWRARSESFLRLLAVDADAEQATGASAAMRLGAGGLRWVDMLPQRGLNVYDVMRHDVLLLSLPALRELEARLDRPIQR